MGRTYGERSKLCTNLAARELFYIMQTKKTNLSFSADLTTKNDLLRLAELVGPHICLLKTHINIVDDFDADLTADLTALATKHNFLIFEDMKAGDIGNTVRHQYGGGIYRIADWAHITNCHIIPGPGIIDGMRSVGGPKGRGLLLLAEMSSKGSLATGPYTEAAASMALDHSDFVIGFVASRRLIYGPNSDHLITMTPGVNFSTNGDKMGQQYNTPHTVINERHSDIIIVGRGIYQADDPLYEAISYKEAGWAAYTKRL